MEKQEYMFCMKQFKPAIVGLAVLVIAVLSWSIWHLAQGNRKPLHLSLAAAIAAPAKTINVKDRAPHPFWGNCNKCHVTVGAGKPISQVMANVPVSINDKMPHKPWGNCLLCHQVTDGFLAQKNPLPARAAALERFTARSLGLDTKAVTGAMMREFGLANEDGALVLEVAPDSIAAKAGLRKGDEIIRVGKARVDSTNTLEAALTGLEPGSHVKFNIYRGKKSRNLVLKIPKSFSVPITPAAAVMPMRRNLVVAQPGRAPLPPTLQDVTQSPQRRPGLNLNQGKVAVAALGKGLDSPVSHDFGASPYFIVYDPGQNTYRVSANPNANDATGRGVQTGHYVVDLGASNVIAGNFRPNAIHTLKTLRVGVFPGPNGSVREALSLYMAGNLAPAPAGRNDRLARPGRNLPPGGGGDRVLRIF